MGVFNTQLKSFESDILGHVVKLTVNNAVYIHLKEDYGLSQKDYAEALEEDQNITGCKFVSAVLRANGYDADYKEVAENTTESEVWLFITQFQSVLWSVPDDETKEVEEDDKKKKNKK